MAHSKKVTARSQQQSTKRKASPDDQPQAESTKKAKAKVGELNNKDKDDSSALECTLPDFKEPDVPWGECKARDLLIQDIIDEVVPREPCPSMPSQVIFTSRPEYAEYRYKDFCNRLSRLRAQVKQDITQADDDLEAFNHYNANNIAHKITAHGYPEWEGSKAQSQLKEDIDNNLHEMLEPKELLLYREVYDDFPLDVFHDHIYQEIKTRKYFHTLDVKGKSGMKPRKSKQS
jgi:hypothetical protein